MKQITRVAIGAVFFLLFLSPLSHAQYDTSGEQEMEEMERDMDVHSADTMAPETGEMDVLPGDAIDSEGTGAH